MNSELLRQDFVRKACICLTNSFWRSCECDSSSSLCLPRERLNLHTKLAQYSIRGEARRLNQSTLFLPRKLVSKLLFRFAQFSVGYDSAFRRKNWRGLATPFLSRFWYLKCKKPSVGQSIRETAKVWGVPAIWMSTRVISASRHFRQFPDKETTAHLGGIHLLSHHQNTFVGQAICFPYF